MNGVKITAPSDLAFWKVVEGALQKIIELVDFPKKEARELQVALKELFENAVIHAYKDEKGEIEVTIELYDNAIFASVKDRGEPFDERLFKAVPLDLQEKENGFNKILRLVDDFKYFNLGMEGKKFSIAKFVPYQLKLKENVAFYSDIYPDLDEDAKAHLKEKLNIRTFQEGDEVWIPKLIYRNYGYTYFKETFYHPEKILELERAGKILSIVAEVEEKIVGHFALVRVVKSNIAEIGIAVVDPAFKGMGIMKEMFHLLIKKAKELGLSALFGEAITFHPYSQRANARFGFCTTALMLGDVHQMVRLKGHKYPFKQRRGAVALEYKILKPRTKRIALPKRYRKWIEQTYRLCHLPYIPKHHSHFGKDKVYEEFNHAFNIATIVIDGASQSFKSTFQKHFEKAIAKHPDMIYADISLEEVGAIDHVVEVLRGFDFFYSGIAFLRRYEKDYLRMQFEASENIEEQEIRCYSDMCKRLHHFILEDKASLSQHP